MKASNVSIDPISDKRFELLRALGEGGSGAVFLALDRETGEHVALKKLFKLDQKSVQRFKREFRSLADIHHPNLVKLYDLHRGQEAWFLTMEFVQGKDLRQQFGKELRLTSDSIPTVNNPGPLLEIFHQLACGVEAIHRAGMLHRDLKPSNVMVSETGRVVVLDFGLVREIEETHQLTQEGTVSGTPAYMPPEQASDDALSAASDWYAFGVMLYEAIAGRLPIDGRNVMDLMQRKLSCDPAPLRDGAPREVLELCMALLSRAPDERPSGAKVLEVLAAASGGQRERSWTQEQSLSIDPMSTVAQATLFGRDAELAQLRAADADSTRRQSLVVHVRGTSGSGKSALVEQFLDEATSNPWAQPLVLRSRCYEREAMPFKALDGIVDALAAHLSRLDDLTVAHVLPADVGELTRLFPVFERLDAVNRLRASRPVGDEALIRRRAEQALRALITNLGTARRLMLWIDDMQWGDLDSAGVLRDWLERPLEAPVLIMLSYRSEEVQTSSSLARLLERPQDMGRALQLSIDLQPLAASDVRALCWFRLAQQASAPTAMIERIVREARGNPFWAQQLCAIGQAKLASGDNSLDGLSMEALVERASAFIGESARALLNVLAIAGRPLRPQLALTTAGVFSAGRAHIHTLRGLRLVRTRDMAGERLLEVYHDRVREAVQASLSAQESASIHGKLLRALESTGRDDHDFLYTLALGAGERALAFRHGLLAAERASTTLAFERAAELYAKCIELFDGEIELSSLWMKLAAAQSHCRRGYAAATSYSRAAEHAPVEQRARLLQLAASHFVRSGRFDEGERIVQRVLESRHLHVPATNAGMLAALAWEYGRIGLRKYEVRERAPGGLVPVEVEDALLYGNLSAETQLYAPLRSALFQARSLRLAIDYGDANQLARALCLAAAIACLSGTTRAARRSRALLARAEELFRRSGSYEEGRLELLSSRALCAQFTGGVEDVLEPALAVERMLQEQRRGGAHGDYYYLFIVRMTLISALQSLGRLEEARKWLSEHIARANETDNRCAVLQVSMNRVIDEQALNQCAGTRARLDAEYAELPKGATGILSAGHVLAVMRAACATRDYDWGFQRVAEFWEPYVHSVLHRSTFLAILQHTTHARLLLNHHVETRASGDPALLVRSDLAHLKRLPPSVLRDVGITRVRGRLAVLRGERARAIALLRPILAQFETTSLKQEIGHDQYTLGLLLGGDEGAQLKAAGRATLLECGITDPDSNMRAYVPELMLE